MKKYNLILLVAILFTGTVATAYSQQRVISAAAMFIPPKGNVWQTLDMGATWFQHTPEVSEKIRKSQMIQSSENQHTNLAVSPSVVQSGSTEVRVSWHNLPNGNGKVYAVNIAGEKFVLWEGNVQSNQSFLSVEVGKLTSGVYSLVF